MLNLIHDAWIPVMGRGGPPAPAARRLVAPHQLAEEDVSRVCWGRADFNLACREMLIGMLQLAFPPLDEVEWLRRFRAPDPDEWRRALEPWAEHFELFGPGPRFAQDLEPFELQIRPDRIRSTSGLFVDSPGSNTIARNADILTGRLERPLAPGEAAMALYTLQAYAPAGGPGYRVSIRGGGPLTTLVAPVSSQEGTHALARQLLANVLPGPALRPAEAALALPWLRPTRSSEDGSVVRPGDSHPAESYFSMPRRLRLMDADMAGERINSFCQLPHGASYRGWRHPFSPQYRRSASSEWLPVRSAPPGPDQRHSLAWSLPERQGGTTRPAPVVDAFRLRNAGHFEILAGGWAFSRAKPLNFATGLFPAAGLVGDGELERLDRIGRATAAYASELRRACGLSGAAGDMLVEEFLRSTSLPYRAAIAGIKAGRGDEVEAAWHERMLTGALDLAAEATSPMRNERCRSVLLSSFAGVAMRKLGLPTPAATSARTGSGGYYRHSRGEAGR